MNIRQDINGTTPQDLNKMNENFMNMWQKVYGNIDFADGNNSLKERIMTQYQNVIGEGNFDSNYPLYIRFYVPPNVKKLKSAKFNIIVEHYRMDSGVAKDDGGYASGSVALDMSPSNAVITSNLNGISRSSLVDSWGVGTSNEIIAPNVMSNGYTPEDSISTVEPYRFSTNKAFFEATSKQGTIFKLAPLMRGNSGGNLGWYLDLGLLYHDHDISHTHDFSVSDLGHTHSGEVQIEIPPHKHDLNEGIKVSTNSPENVEVFVNSVKVGNTLNGISSISDLDVLDKIIIGEWNIIKVSCSNLARVVLYGIIELVNKY